MSMALDRFCFRVLVANALAVLLSTCILVGGYGCPISMRVVLSGTATCEFINDSPIFASAADAMTFVMILHTF